MNDIIIVGMDIKKQAQKLLDECFDVVTCGMSDSEIKACRLGVRNYESILDSLATVSDGLVMHMPGKDNIEEYTSDEIGSEEFEGKQMPIE